MNELVKVTKNRKKFNILYTLFCCFICLIYFNEFRITKGEEIQQFENKFLIYCIFCLVCILLSIIVWILIKYMMKEKKEIHKCFLTVAIVIGSIHLLLIPFYSGADELGHFCRIYEISKGNFLTPVNENGDTCNELPSSIKKLYEEHNGHFLYSNVYKSLFTKLNENDTEIYKNYYISISLYAPIQYFPQTIGAYIARKLNFNIYFVGMFARITGFIFWLIISTKILKIIPIKKTFFMLLMLSPIFIGYATTLSGDMMLNSMVALLISKVYYFRYTKEKINKKNIIILAMISFVIALCKVVYIPVVLCLLFIPKECFNDKKRYYIIILLITLISLLLAFSWYIYSSNNYLNNFYSNSKLQKNFVIKHPIYYLIVLNRTLIHYSIVYITHSSQVEIFPIISILLWVIVLLSNYNSENKEIKNFVLFEKFVFIFIVLSNVFLIGTAIYIQFTAMTASVGNSLVEGIQMRYFLPVIILSSLFINKKKVLVEDKKLITFFLALQLPIFVTMFIYYF